MDNRTVALEFFDKVCEVDSSVKILGKDSANKSFVIDALTLRFDRITKNHAHLLENVQKRIVDYHKSRGNDGDFTDFIPLVEWFAMSFEDNRKPVDYWDINGKYFGLRMSEVINFFLIAKYQT